MHFLLAINKGNSPEKNQWSREIIGSEKKPGLKPRPCQ